MTEVNVNHEHETTVQAVPQAQPAQVVVEAAPPPAIRVKVVLRNGYYHVDLHGKEMPPKQLVLAELTAAQRNLIRTQYKNKSYYTVHDCMTSARESISASVWSAAIAKAMVNQMSQPRESTVELGEGTDFAYAAIGGHLYQLAPIGVVKTNQALNILRRQLRDKVQVEVEQLRTSAEAAAQAVIQAANRKLAEAEEVKRRATQQQPPPQWALDRGLLLRKVAGRSWQVGMLLKIVFTRWVMWQDGPEEVVWNVPPEQWAVYSPVRVLCWVPVDTEGNYNQTSIMVDGSLGTVLPHMTTSQACMSIGDAPARLNSYGEWEQLRLGIERCFQTVNMGSLYSGVEAWRGAFKDFIPPELQEAVMGPHPGDAVARMGRVIRDRRIAEAAEAAEAARRRNETPPAPARFDEESTDDVFSA